MAKAMTTPTDDRPVTLEIERAGRRFPDLPESRKRATRGRIRELQTQPSEESLPQSLAQALQERLVWRQVQAAASPSREAVVAAYVESLKQLESFRVDVQRLMEALCRANLEFRQGGRRTHVEARDSILDAKLKEMLSQASSRWLPARNVADAKLLSQPPAVYRQQLDASLAQAVTDFAKELFELLARLVDRELCGLVEWLPNHCCRYHFFRRVVIQGDEQRSKRVEVTHFDDSEFLDDGFAQVVGNRRTTRTRKVPHQIRYARHEHEVIDAIRTSLGNSQVVMPPRIKALVTLIPNWLYPFVEVIDGKIIRERIIERDVKVEDWTKVHVRDEPIIDYDPGIVIGPYVLSGWGPGEIAEEQKRQQANTRNGQQEFDQLVFPVFAVAAVVMSLIAPVLLFRALQGHGGLVFAILATVAAIGSVWQAVFGFESRRGSPTAAYCAHFFTAASAFALLLIEWLVARSLYPMFWLTPVVLAGAAVLSFQLGQQIRSKL